MGMMNPRPEGTTSFHPRASSNSLVVLVGVGELLGAGSVELGGRGCDDCGGSVGMTRTIAACRSN